MNASFKAGPILIRRTRDDASLLTQTDLDRLESIAAGPIDTSDLPEATSIGMATLAASDAAVPAVAASSEPSRGLIRHAIVTELNRQGRSGYWLWKAARAHCATLPQSAVHEFLRGQRAVGVEYADAMIVALNLEITSASQREQPKSMNSLNGLAKQSARESAVTPKALER